MLNYELPFGCGAPQATNSRLTLSISDPLRSPTSPDTAPFAQLMHLIQLQCLKLAGINISSGCFSWAPPEQQQKGTKEENKRVD